MSVYQFYQFDGVNLPIYDPEQDLSTGTVDSTLLASVGGTVDVWSGYQRSPRTVKHTVGGIYEATDSAYPLVDHAGNNIVDHAGNRIIAGTAEGILRGQVESLRAKLGVAGSLWRRRWDDTTITQWKTARLLALQQRSERDHRTLLAKVDCVFESAMANWRSSAVDTVSGNLVAGGQVGLLLGGEGNATVEDSVLTVTAAGTITSLQFVCVALGVDLRYAGTIGAGSVLVINCGSQTVTVNGVAAYSGFSLGAGHTARGWLPLPPGPWAMVVSSNGAGTVASSHYDQWV